MMSPPIEVDISLSKRIPKTSNDLTAIRVLSKESSRMDRGNITVQSETYVIGCDR